MIRSSVGNPMLIGYIRGGSDDMDALAAQRQALQDLGCWRVIEELLATTQVLSLAATGITACNVGDIIMPAKVLRSDHDREPGKARLLLTAVTTLPVRS